MSKITKETLDLPMLENDAGAKTFRDYFKALVREVCQRQESFSGKRPFGNSDWIFELYESMIHQNIVKVKDSDRLTSGEYATLDSAITKMVNLL